MTEERQAVSDTPRTDALLLAWEESNNKHGWGMRVVQADDPKDPWDFARQLEREVAELREIAEEYLAFMYSEWHAHMSQAGFDADTTVIKVRAALKGKP